MIQWEKKDPKEQLQYFSRHAEKVTVVDVAGRAGHLLEDVIGYIGREPPHVELAWQTDKFFIEMEMNCPFGAEALMRIALSMKETPPSSDSTEKQGETPTVPPGTTEDTKEQTEAYLKTFTSEKKLADERDAQRRKDVNNILDAVWMYAIDHKGILPFDLPPGEAREICKSGVSDCGDFVNMSDSFDRYLLIVGAQGVPVDPQETSEKGTGYAITLDSEKKHPVISAPNTENMVKISVSR